MDTDVVLGVGMEGPMEGIKSRDNWMGQNRYGLAVTQMISEVKAAPETVTKRRVIVRPSVKTAAPLIAAPAPMPTSAQVPINPFNMF